MASFALVWAILAGDVGSEPALAWQPSSSNPDLREFVSRLTSDPNHAELRNAARRGDLRGQPELTGDDIAQKIEELKRRRHSDE